MASFRPKVLNTNGQDALLDADDNLTLEHAPQVDTDATNKLYVDTEIDTAETNLTADYDAKIQAEADARIAADDALLDAINAEAQTRADEDAALQEQINLINGNEPGSDNPYVKRTGDDMSGNLTLGTDKITLNATEGIAEFAGKATSGNSPAGGAAQGTEMRPNGQIVVTGAIADDVFAGYEVGTSTTTSLITSSGNATFAGTLEAASVDGGTY